LNASHITTEFGNGLIQLRLPAARNEDVGPLFDKALGGSKSDTAAAPVMTATFPSSPSSFGIEVFPSFKVG
jgi:hypothetical protein